MKFRGQEAWCSFVCQMDDPRLEPKYRSYRLRFSTAGGQRNPQPVLHRIDVLRDLPPEIEILAPAQDRVEVAEDGWQKLEIRAVDPDYGLTAIRLRATAGGRQVLARDLLQDPAGRQGQELVSFNFARAPQDCEPVRRPSAGLWRKTIARRREPARRNRTSSSRGRLH